MKILGYVILILSIGTLMTMGTHPPDTNPWVNFFERVWGFVFAAVGVWMIMKSEKKEKGE